MIYSFWIELYKSIARSITPCNAQLSQLTESISGCHRVLLLCHRYGSPASNIPCVYTEIADLPLQLSQIKCTADKHGGVVSTAKIRTIAAFLWARELVFTGSKLLVFMISQEVSQHQKHGVRWRKWAWHTKCRLLTYASWTTLCKDAACLMHNSLSHINRAHITNYA